MHGTDEHRQKDQYGYRALALIAHSARQIQTHAFKQVSNTASENIIPEVSGGNTQFPDCYNISWVPAAREKLTMELSGDNQTQQATVFPPVWVYVS